ncbi:MAG: hypothetical protein ACE5G5_10080 [Candidatus Methylomirabilales bacterium]
MKRFAALTLALAIFTAPAMALAADSADLSGIFNQYQETILLDEGE